MEHPMMGSARPWILAVSCLLGAAVQAQPTQTTDAATVASVQLLDRVQKSAQELAYSGVFTYQQGPSMQSSRVTHIADARGERERLEVLDGQPLEFLRNNDEVQCLIPEHRAVLVEKRPARDRFPGLIQGKASQLAEYYQVSVEPQHERVADRDCQIINLQAKDDNRYGYRLCADTESGLLLRTQTLAADNVVVEQVAFITLQIGEGVDPKQLKPKWNTKDWKVIKTKMTPTDISASGWSVGETHGFTRVTQVQRSMGGKPNVKQIMLSDGLAAISVFIEPMAAGHPQQVSATSRGAIHAVGRRIGDHWITVLGEAPLETIQRVAQSVSYTKPEAPKP